ncbi:MAG TPA: hypothetical protein VFU48_08340, partial [Nitrospira sp.]|nr:hypothetical protein [Nitrospira sp.]
MRIIVSLLVISLTMASACAPTHKVFPPQIMENIDRDFDFSHWRMVNDGTESRKVQLGGRVVQSQVSADTVTIV